VIAPAAPRSLFGPHMIDALDDDSVGGPAPLDFSEEDRPGAASRADLTYERPRHRWEAIEPAPPMDGLPVRFIDGTIATRLAGSLTVEGRRRPIVAATIAAAALELRDGALARCPGAITRRVIAIYEDGIDPADLDRAEAALGSHRIALLRRAMESGPRDFDTMRESTKNRAMDEMEASERDVLLRDPATPTLVDGLLERRLVRVADRSLPVIGLVKQHAATYLPSDLQELLYRLRPGQRTPAFAMEVDGVPLVNAYVRLSAIPGASPSYGVVRVTAPVAFLERAFPGAVAARFLSALAGYLYRLRCRDEAYGRAGISIEPVVRVETHLRAIRPDIDALLPKLHRLFGGRLSEASA
jgi:hypothetical protein